MSVRFDSFNPKSFIAFPLLIFLLVSSGCGSTQSFKVELSEEEEVKRFDSVYLNDLVGGYVHSVTRESGQKIAIVKIYQKPEILPLLRDGLQRLPAESSSSGIILDTSNIEKNAPAIAENAIIPIQNNSAISFDIPIPAELPVIVIGGLFVVGIAWFLLRRIATSLIRALTVIVVLASTLFLGWQGKQAMVPLVTAVYQEIPESFTDNPPDESILEHRDQAEITIPDGIKETVRRKLPSPQTMSLIVSLFLSFSSVIGLMIFIKRSLKKVL